MDEISLLQRKLQEIQLPDLLPRISSRISIEILMKIQEIYQLSLIITTDGLEFLTKDHLFGEIQHKILDVSKLSKQQISDFFNVNPEKIEPILMKIIEKNKEITRIHDIFFTEQYFSGICNEINEDLSRNTIIFLSDISMKYEISIDFLMNFLQKKLENHEIYAKISCNKLISIDFEVFFSAKLKGLLMGSSFPISLLSIKERIQEKSIETEEIREKIKQFISKNEIYGEISDFFYFPCDFLQKTQEKIQKFLLGNRYIHYKFISDFHIENPEKYLKKRFPEEKMVFFNDFAVFPEFFSNFTEEILKEIENEGFFSLEKTVDFSMKKEDSEKIFESFFMNFSLEISENFLFKKEKTDEICGILQEKMRISLKNQKKLKRIITKEMIFKEITVKSRFPSVFYDESAQKALISLIYQKLSGFSSEKQQISIDLTLEKLINRIKNMINSIKFSFSRYKEAKNTEENSKNPENLFNQCIFLLEITIFFNIKRFSLEIPQHFLFSEENSLDFFSENGQIFKNKGFAEKTIGFLPEKVKILLEKAEEMLMNDDFDGFFEFFEEEELEIYGVNIKENDDFDMNYRSPQKKKRKLKLKHTKSRSLN